MFSRRNTQSKLTPRLLSAIDRLLIAGIRAGPAKKRDAVNKVLQVVPEWKRGDCWERIRQLRRTAALAGLGENTQRDEPDPPEDTRPVLRLTPRSWTRAEDDLLLKWAGYERVNKISRRLGRSERAVRYRLCALGMSAKIADGWSLRALRKLLRVSPVRLTQFVGKGMLRVRDPRVTTSSLAAFCDRNRASLAPRAIERVAAALAKNSDAYRWGQVADLLGVPLTTVKSWICAGQLKVMDPLVTDRSLENFCHQHGTEINTALIDPATVKWLVKEYGVPDPAGIGQAVRRALKHALVTRKCECGREIAGNAYFKHAKTHTNFRLSEMAPTPHPIPDGESFDGRSRRNSSSKGATLSAWPRKVAAIGR